MHRDVSGSSAVSYTRKRQAQELSEAKISPPPSKRQASEHPNPPAPEQRGTKSTINKTIASPFQLTCIRDLPESLNKDTVSLWQLIGDPLIRECWLFDYLFDVDFIIKHLDPDVKHLVAVKIIHGSWRKDDTNKIEIDRAVARHENVEAITAYMPEAFGTHHSKMMVLFRRDETVQVIIHTANMIPRDWRNMTQAVWQSPRLPSLSEGANGQESNHSTDCPVGSGLRFKIDLMRYLRHYGDRKTGKLTSQLAKFDFSNVKAALITSVPTRVSSNISHVSETAHGWLGLREILREVDTNTASDETSHVVVQVSSVAYMGKDWIKHFFNVLKTSKPTLESRGNPENQIIVHVMFPTNEEIRDCLDGYNAGGSIHMRVQSNRARQQLDFLQPKFVRWAGSEDSKRDETSSNAGRRTAAPHIKTYVKYTNDKMDQIDWAMLTSANLSTQAWGSLEKDSRVQICSYEVGVVVWPSNLADGDRSAVMVSSFQKDMPDSTMYTTPPSKPIVGFRMPYDIPLCPYTGEDNAWCVTADYDEPDWMGNMWKPSTFK